VIDVLLVLYASQFTTFYVLFGAPFIWGCTETFRATRYLLATTQPEAELEPRPTHAPGHSDELAVLDGLLHRGRLNDGAYELAKRKLDRKYNVSVPAEHQAAGPDS
jgi:hypothetical protein